MDREEEIKVLMVDHCTKDEAIKHLKTGTTVYNITKEPWDETYADEVGISLREIKENGRKYDFSYLKVDDVEYIIEYVL
ncbi:hypothetical protein [Selenomonas ruminantium]|uniref:hypothetical protein n=1 Tax=Selenomonas ruminantium TaxID=971 RepID=UPI0026ED3014|nr:hypothetical protein [Selenomonas ruminantium]